MELKTLFTEPIMDMVNHLIGYLPKLGVALMVLVVGWILAKFITKIFITFLRTVDFDKLSGKMGLTKVLKTGGITEKPSTLFGCIVYWIMMIGVLTAHVKALGLEVVSTLLDKVIGYIPSVISGVMVLIIGMLIARVVSVLIYIVAKNTDMPIPETLSKLSKWAIVAFVAVVYLKEIGFGFFFTGPAFSVVLSGIVFAIALAFGLAGKDIASKYLTFLSKK